MKAVVFTLGCKVNECESASLIRGLEEMGCEVSDELGEADLYIINTCAVTHEAEKKSRQTIARVSKYSPSAKIIICGCASQNHPESFTSKPNVKVVTGAQKKSEILSLLEKEGEYPACDGTLYDEMLPPLRLKTRAFVKVQDGCNNFCSYCIIPYLRGRSRSRNFDGVIEEIKKNGAKETVVVGIDLSSYNSDGKSLKDIVYALKDEDQRIRLGSLELGVVTRDFLSALRECKNFAPHFHLSLQSGSSAVLKKMNRHYTREEYLGKCALIYEYFPDAAITTDIIVGFPTETEEDLALSLKIIEEAKFAHVHSFTYSQRSGTVASKTMKDLPFEVKKERHARLMKVAERQSKEYISRFIGSEAEIVKEEFSNGFTQGYTANYIRVYIEGDIQGEVIKVRLKESYLDGVKAEAIL